MPLIHKSKSRIRFQGRNKKVKLEDPETAQYKPVRTVYGGASDSTSATHVANEELLFAKKRVPSADKLGVMLRSNLSASFAAAKASTAKQNAPRSPPTPTSILVTQPQDSDDDPSASFLELAPIYRPVNDHLEATNSGAVIDEEGTQADSPSASVLVATEVDEQAEACPYSAPPISETDTSTAESCAVEDDNDPPVSLLVETRESFVEYIKPTIRSKTVPIQSTKSHPTFLQKLATLFAGQPRCPSDGGHRLRSVAEHDKVQRNPPPPPRSPIPPKNFPLSPPVVATHRPYQPLEENLHAPFIEPAKGHKYTGDYYVAPDTFEPAEFQVSFASPTSPASTTSTVRRQNSDGILLDRNGTAWGNWYSKKPKPEDLPFAKVHRIGNRLHDLAKDITEQQAWDAHRTSLVQPRTCSTKHMSDMDVSRDADAEDQERAARLRNHPGHCYGAVTGDVYPFQGGLII